MQKYLHILSLLSGRIAAIHVHIHCFSHHYNLLSYFTHTYTWCSSKRCGRKCFIKIMFARVVVFWICEGCKSDNFKKKTKKGDGYNHQIVFRRKLKWKLRRYVFWICFHEELKYGGRGYVIETHSISVIHSISPYLITSLFSAKLFFLGGGGGGSSMTFFFYQDNPS